MSERPKVQLSKSCVGESPPWVQIPPSPLLKSPVILGFAFSLFLLVSLGSSVRRGTFSSRLDILFESFKTK